MLERWKKAVVHLEGATDSVPFNEQMDKQDKLVGKLRSGEITFDDYCLQINECKRRDLRYNGTALFFIRNTKRYLLTARHVLFDERPAHMESQGKGPLMIGNYYRDNKIFNIIFRVQSLDEVNKLEGRIPTCLMNLNAGTTYHAPYTFSDPDVDLAIISLDHDQFCARFADDLLQSGYIPVSFDGFGDEPTQEGSELFTVGYPAATSTLGVMNMHPAAFQWSSQFFSLPTFSFGKVSMLHEKLPFYWADMSIYPGNSGGPVIENDKLVGVVSAQAIITNDHFQDISQRIPFAKIIKSKYVCDLLQIQDQKDEYGSSTILHGSETQKSEV